MSKYRYGCNAINKFGDQEIKNALEEWYNHKNPIFKTNEYGSIRLNETIFDTMRKPQEKLLLHDCPVDEDGCISVYALFDIITGSLLTHTFKTIKIFEVGNKKYHHIAIPNIIEEFVIDLDNKRSFHPLGKAIQHGHYIKDISNFGTKEIIIFRHQGDEYCMDNTGNILIENARRICKETQGCEGIDILKISKRRTENYSIDDSGMIDSYLGSDGKRYEEVICKDQRSFKIKG